MLLFSMIGELSPAEISFPVVVMVLPKPEGAVTEKLVTTLKKMSKGSLQLNIKVAQPTCLSI